MKTKERNIFTLFNRYPFERVRRHALELFHLYEDPAKGGHYESCYDEISPPPEDLECEKLGSRIEKIWQRELNSKGPIKASLSLVLFRCLVWDFIDAFIWTIFVRIISVFSIVESVSRILTSIDEYNELSVLISDHPETSDNSTVITTNTGAKYKGLTDELDDIYFRIVVLVIILFLSVSTFFIMYSYLKVKFTRCGLKCRVAMIQLIHRKSLRLHLSTSIEQSSTAAMSLVTNEVTFIEETNKFLMYLVVGPMALILSFVWLSLAQVDWRPAACTVPVLVCFILIQLYLPNYYKKFSQMRKEQTNKRIDAINTFLSSVKVVKMYAWEQKFREKIGEFRSQEMKYNRALDKFTLLDHVTVCISSKILSSIVVLAHICISNQLDMRILFTTTTIYNFFRFDGLFYFPKSVRCLSDLRTACENIKTYLLLKEMDDNRVKEMTVSNVNGCKIRIKSQNLQVSLSENRNSKSPNELKQKQKQQSSLATKLNFQQTDRFDARNLVIDGLNMDLKTGDLVFVVGPVGSGKSSLLLTLLGETRIVGGQLSINNRTRFAYAPQEACIFADTFRNNILNGRNFNLERYERTVEMCSLAQDIGLLPAGDETLVGPRGVSLSGGQRARLSLARAIYSDADVYILDDPLSALDAKVARHIMSKCIKGFLAPKLVVLATHQIQFLELASKVIVLTRGVKPICYDKFEEEISAQKSDYKQVIDQMLNSMPTNQSNAEFENENKIETETQISIAKDESKKVEQSCRIEANRVGGKKVVGKKSAYLFLVKLGFTKQGLALFAMVMLANIVANSSSDYYFRFWSQSVIGMKNNTGHVDKQTELSSVGTKEVFVEPISISESDHSMTLLDYWGINFALICLLGLTNYQFLSRLICGLRQSTETLHSRLIESLFRAKMSFYDFCQTGELSSRYAGDFTVVDHVMLFNFLLTVSILIGVISSLAPMIIINPYQLIPFVVLAIISWPVVKSNYPKLRRLIELSKDLRSPMLTNLASSVDDLATIRSEPDHLRQVKVKFSESQNKLTSATLISFLYEAYLTSLTKTLAMLALGGMLYIMFGPYLSSLDLSTAGTLLLLAINSAGSFPALLEYATLLETSMVSVENVRRYAELEPEIDEQQCRPEAGLELNTKANSRRALTFSGAKQVSERKWKAGRIIFSQVSLKYFEDERPAISELNFRIESGEKIGVVGRTGAGKSSIVSILYRLYPFEGSITIDNVNTKSLSLAELRSSIGVIPQDPVLFCDSLRKNLDPFDVYSDQELWHTLSVVNLREFVIRKLPLGLEQQMSEGGRNFSVGQRQLVCLARAILKATKILLVDEATANVDAETDALIQRTIREQFKESTIITIAHRLSTVLDYDRILVLDAGKVIEFDTVERLLEIENGVFKSLLRQQQEQKQNKASLATETVDPLNKGDRSEETGEG